MPIVRINAAHATPVPHDTRFTLDETLDRQLGDAGPIMVLVHGFKYRPSSATACPHAKIFSDDPVHGLGAWPRHLGFGQGEAQEGTAIAFGWDARGHLRRVHARAADTGRALAHLIRRIKTHAPDRPLHILCHSLGSEVALQALHHLLPGDVQRLICLTGASYQSAADAALQSPAGRKAELINVTSRENDLFDFLFERLVPAPTARDRALGQGVSARNMVTVQLDHPDHLAALASLGGHITPTARRICHWSAYLRPGALQVWARAMRCPEQMPLHLMSPTPPAPRWSRLIRSQPPLPALLKPAT